MNIYYKNIYTTKSGKNVLIIYNISKRHYIGLILHKEETKDENSIYINSINFYYRPIELKEFKYSDLLNNLYIKGKSLRITNSDFKKINTEIKKFLTNKIFENGKGNTIDNFIYMKWIHDIFTLNLKDDNILNYKIKSRCIYWVNFGYGIGSELRKIRPAILWRHTSDKKICTFIPLSSKCNEDKFYFHCDLNCIPCSTAKIECIQNFSNKRIIEPFRLKGKFVYIDNEDQKNISNNLKQFYTYT